MQEQNAAVDQLLAEELRRDDQELIFPHLADELGQPEPRGAPFCGRGGILHGLRGSGVHLAMSICAAETLASLGSRGGRFAAFQRGSSRFGSCAGVKHRGAGIDLRGQRHPSRKQRIGIGGIAAAL